MILDIDVLNDDEILADRFMLVFLFGFCAALVLRFVESAYKTTLQLL